MDSTQYFSGLADAYTIGRPAYAKAFVDSLYSRYGFSEQSVIADIGCGTGKLAKQLLERGSFVYGVEPNADMRETALEELGGCGRFQAVDGTAAETNLEEQSVDFITAAQAFHWFDVFMFRKECKRILKENGTVFLIWNLRDTSDKVNQSSFEIFSEYCPKFHGFSGGVQKDDLRIREFFRDKYEYIEFENPLSYDRDKFISRSLSSSYSLKKGDEKYGEYIAALSAVFERYAKNNVLTVANKTVAYVGRMKEVD